MTAEVAILNRQAIALAADSAVTINYPGGLNYPTRLKVYNSVNKLFMLSKYAPVGIMVFGSADLTGVPWETIIKSFRRSLGDKRLPLLRNYAEELITFINNHKILFSEAQQRQQFITSVMAQYLNVLRDFDKRSESAIAAGGPATVATITALLTKTVREHHTEWTSATQLPSVPPTYPARIRRKWAAEINAAMTFVFERLPLTTRSKTQLREIAGLVFSANKFPGNMSGIVVAGFGENEFFPSVISYDVEGVLLNYVKIRQQDAGSHTVVSDDDVAIIPFAQHEMVELFMEGIDPRFKMIIRDALEELLNGVKAEIDGVGNVSAASKLRLGAILDAKKSDFVTAFVDKLAEHSDHRHVQPVITAVSHLPKEELAAMAETLVNLTSFKRRVTRDPETVGGPVDVAVISKGDGFIWIKRKHYFDPALNQHFLQTYYR